MTHSRHRNIIARKLLTVIYNFNKWKFWKSQNFVLMISQKKGILVHLLKYNGFRWKDELQYNEASENRNAQFEYTSKSERITLAAVPCPVIWYIQGDLGQLTVYLRTSQLALLNRLCNSLLLRYRKWQWIMQKLHCEWPHNLSIREMNRTWQVKEEADG